MSVEHALVLSADDRKQGMTLAELGLFVQQAYKADIPPETPVKVSIGWTQQIQRIEVRQ